MTAPAGAVATVRQDGSTVSSPADGPGSRGGAGVPLRSLQDAEGIYESILPASDESLLPREIEAMLLRQGFDGADATRACVTDADQSDRMLIVTDRHLPGPSGLDRLLRVRSGPGRTRLILMSGGVHPAAAAAAIGRGLTQRRDAEGQNGSG